jgi:hypothetical protein
VALTKIELMFRQKALIQAYKALALTRALNRISNGVRAGKNAILNQSALLLEFYGVVYNILKGQKVLAHRATFTAAS